jgi:hypothetical protein
MPSDEKIYAYTHDQSQHPTKVCYRNMNGKSVFTQASKSQGLQDEDAKAEWSIPDLDAHFERGCVGLTCAAADLR